MPECHTPFLGHCDLDLLPSFKKYCVQSISPILFDVGIPNLGWWFLLGWLSGAYHFESLWPWHWLLASFLGFSCYITANFPQMRLMIDQFLWGIRHVFVTFLVLICLTKNSVIYRFSKNIVFLWTFVAKQCDIFFWKSIWKKSFYTLNVVVHYFFAECIFKELSGAIFSVQLILPNVTECQLKDHCTDLLV